MGTRYRYGWKSTEANIQKLLPYAPSQNRYAYHSRGQHDRTQNGLLNRRKPKQETTTKKEENNMSCGCGGGCGGGSGCRGSRRGRHGHGTHQVVAPFVRQKVQNTIVIDGDYDVFPTNEAIVAFSPLGGTGGTSGSGGTGGTVTVFLDPDALVGQPIQLTAASANIIVEGNGNTVVGSAFVPIGSRLDYTYAGNGLHHDSTTPGMWVPQTGATGG